MLKNTLIAVFLLLALSCFFFTITPTHAAPMPVFRSTNAQAAKWTWWPYANNVWGYTFVPTGRLVTFSPRPASWDSRRYFCVSRIFDCVPNFWLEHGYVEQCRDGIFDKLGGSWMACRMDGGYWRTLYWQ